MLLKDLEIIPGVVIDANDPENLLRVKASVPGLFDTSTMDVKALPWIYRFPVGGHQQFSKLMTGSLIWVLKNKSNYFEFWYIPFPQFNKNTGDIAKVDADVVVSRYIADGNAQLYYNGEDGFKTVLGENYIQLDSSGNAINMSNGVSSKIDGAHYYVGTDEGNYEPMVLGQQLVNLLSQLSSDLNLLEMAAAGFPSTSHLAPPIRTMKQNLDSQLFNILSKTCSLT